MENSISFPNIGITLEDVGKTIDIFGFKIAYYGIIIGIGMFTGLLIAQKEAKRTGQRPEDYSDMFIILVITSIIGARLYYVLFSWDSYKDDLLKIFMLRQGGLAIYGGVIASGITVWLFAKKRKLSFLKLADTCSLGLVMGQVIGRWGNFFNREAFGGYTNSLLAMKIPLTSVRTGDLTTGLLEHTIISDGITYIQVHPTFLYESLWNLCLFLFLTWKKKRNTFEGETFFFYIIGYGLGRSWIEGLRTDQLLIPGIQLPVSQVLAIVFVIVGSFIVIYKKKLERKIK